MSLEPKATEKTVDTTAYVHALKRARVTITKGFNCIENVVKALMNTPPAQPIMHNPCTLAAMAERISKLSSTFICRIVPCILLLDTVDAAAAVAAAAAALTAAVHISVAAKSSWPPGGPGCQVVLAAWLLC